MILDIHSMVEAEREHFVALRLRRVALGHPDINPRVEQHLAKNHWKETYLGPKGFGLGAWAGDKLVGMTVMFPLETKGRVLMGYRFGPGRLNVLIDLSSAGIEWAKARGFKSVLIVDSPSYSGIAGQYTAWGFKSCPAPKGLKGKFLELIL